MSNEAQRNFNVNINGQDSPQEKITDENGDLEEVDVVIKKHIRRNSGGSFSNDLLNIQEVSHPNFERFVKNNINTPDIERNDDNNSQDSEWKIGKCKCTKNLIIFIIRVVMSLIVMIFCIYKLSSTITLTDKTLYVSMLSTTVASWMPSPMEQKKK